MNHPTISIATISFNQCAYLGQAIGSVVDQIGDDMEYLIFDGGSTDGSRELIESFDDRLSYWQSCPDGGPAKALQAALERSRGTFFMYLNSDDYFLPGALKTVHDAIRKHPEADVLYGNGLTLDERNGTVTRTFSDRWNLRAYAVGAVSIFQQSCAIRRDLALGVGGFNIENTTCWDGELLFDLGRANASFQRLPDDLAVFRLHEASISGSHSRQEIYFNDRVRMAKKVGIDRYSRPSWMTSVRKALRQPDIALQKFFSRFQRFDGDQPGTVCEFVPSESNHLA